MAGTVGDGQLWRSGGETHCCGRPRAHEHANTRLCSAHRPSIADIPFTPDPPFSTPSAAWQQPTHSWTHSSETHLIMPDVHPVASGLRAAGPLCSIW